MRLKWLLKPSCCADIAVIFPTPLSRSSLRSAQNSLRLLRLDGRRSYLELNNSRQGAVIFQTLVTALPSVCYTISIQPSVLVIGERWMRAFERINTRIYPTARFAHRPLRSPPLCLPARCSAEDIIRDVEKSLLPPRCGRKYHTPNQRGRYAC